MQLGLLPQEVTPDAVLCALQARRGAANGITARDLVYTITGRVSPSGERRLRTVIDKLRRDGHPIAAHPALGYFWAITQAEIDGAVGYLVGRAMTTLEIAGAMKRIAVPDLYGQFGLLRPSQTTEEPEDECN